ncbi:murein L,D-transpeptidase catalytic domain-containing protein [Qipengyuania soli]|uniref:murein L,D-transpeptidase catalytic domain-containing protein n=1 Tax=Qipengyuania soli TaxID=2782568 RepID=UPI001FE5B7B0|nr:murein L,D-transpeptidase catalytic domain family protein [Qipengyuania soli]
MVKRRDILRGGLAAGLASALPARVFAQVNPTASRDRELMDLARSELARVGSGIWKKDIVGVADFGLHSAERRFHFVDVVNERVQSFHVSHGDGSDPQHDGWLKYYSNQEGSHCTSRGAYMTRSWYTGKFGTSIRLDGLDPSNSEALPRAIVMHQASYATPEHVSRWGRLGRSNGCFAMGPEQFDRALIDLSGGRLLVAGSYGLTETGGRMNPPLAQTDLLVRDPATGTFDRTNPGVY